MHKSKILLLFLLKSWTGCTLVKKYRVVGSYSLLAITSSSGLCSWSNNFVLNGVEIFPQSSLLLKNASALLDLKSHNCYYILQQAQCLDAYDQMKHKHESLHSSNCFAGWGSH